MASQTDVVVQVEDHRHPRWTPPESKLTLFALRLAVLEKAASGIGALGFIWATVVILGGFAITIDSADFWLVTTILLIEGARIFSRSHELEWQHHSTSSWSSLSSAARRSFRALKSRVPADFVATKQPEDHPPRSKSHANWAFLSASMSRLLYWLQLLSATTCIVLSLSRLARQDYGEVAKGDTDKRNRKSALNIFYGLALAEAALFLMERSYWEFEVSFRNLLSNVARECDLGHGGMVSVRRFFYDAYSRCVNGSIFDGLKMDMVSFAGELLFSESMHEELIGARILARYAMSERYGEEAVRKVGASAGVVERLVEILSWEGEMRRCAAQVVERVVAAGRRNGLRVARVGGAMESIETLLRVHDAEMHRVGLRILKKLPQDHECCARIGSTRGLLRRIVEFTALGETLLACGGGAEEARIKVAKRALQLLKMLASTPGPTGTALRKEISEIVFTISNIRDILCHGASHAKLQKLAIEVLTSLTMDTEARERIGGTGGVIKHLLGILLRDGESKARVEAGEALAVLALESELNCRRMLRLSVVDGLVAVLGDPEIGLVAGGVLHNLCAYSEDEDLPWLGGVFAAAPMVLKAIMTEEKRALQAHLGLATQLFRLMNPEDISEGIVRANIKEVELAKKLIQILKENRQPSIKVPRMRRFAMELAIWMMRLDKRNVIAFKASGLEQELRIIADTTSELELYKVFNGDVGLGRHDTSICSLVEASLEMLACL